MVEKGNRDFCAVVGEKNFIKALEPNEEVLASCKVIKFNKRNKGQERICVVTTSALYNLKGSKIQRKIELESIVGVTTSSTGDEFVVHCPEEYDYRFNAQKKKDLIQALSEGHEKRMQGRALLYIWETADTNLLSFATTKGDKKKGISRIPDKRTAINYPSEDRSRGKTMFAKDGKQVGIDDFQLIKVVGRGAFGKVMLVQKKDSGETYAMKSLRKDALIERGQVEHTRTEKMIMEHVNHPFLVNLQYCFTTQDKIYFVMSFMRGGELFFHLKEARRFDEKRARFYASCVLLGLGHLHTMDVIYRDMKPENILMDDVGYICLTDFGMAKHVPGNEQTMSFVGTPEYLAPEIIQGIGHSKPADWWSFGILIYEMLVGIPPFYNQNVQLMYELIQHGELRWPTRNPIPDQAKDLISKLLVRDPSQRLGTKGDVEEIKQHPWFQGMDWSQLLNKQIEPPFKPVITEGVMSTENFDSEFTSEEVINTMVPEHRQMLIQQNQGAFEGF